MEMVKIENLSFTYPERQRKALSQIDLEIKEGDFVVICGESGCGKTTLLRLLKRELAPNGNKTGEIYYRGTKLEDLEERTAAGDIGFVMQNPEHQLVTDKVWHELAFGLENMGIPTQVIRRRVGEMSCFFGIDSWFRSPTDRLSGGQKQLLNLASVMAMNPKLLLLDEPTSQLDPIAASDFIRTLQKLNLELGLTIILVEHRLEDVFPIADQAVIMENGGILYEGEPRRAGDALSRISKDHRMLLGMPSAVRIFQGLSVRDKCPLTVKEGRDFLKRHFTNEKEKTMEREHRLVQEETPVMEGKNLWFRYERDLPDVLEGISLDIRKGEFLSILGGNGSGKTTLLRILAGQRHAYRGKIKINGKKIRDYKGKELYRHNVALLPQDPQLLFLKSTVLEDYQEICKVMGYEKERAMEEIGRMLENMGISHLADRHPYDLSGGEQQKAALGKVLLQKPKILLMDEPTKGIDAYAKNSLTQILKELKKQGMTILMVTHDVEFAAENSDRCGMIFDHQLLSLDTPEAFFSDNSFYTTAANRISRHLYRNAITCDDVISMCRRNNVEEEKV